MRFLHSRTRVRPVMEASGLRVAIRPALLTERTRCEALLAAHLRKPDVPRIPVTAVHIANSPSGRYTMMKRTRAGTFAVLLLSLSIARADAHPHDWVTFHSEVLYSAEAVMTGVRHAWTFDDTFSAYVPRASLTLKRDNTRARSWPRSPN
jgi:hypothetical protein